MDASGSIQEWSPDACWAFLRPPHRCQPRSLVPVGGRVASSRPVVKDLDRFYLASAADCTIPTRYA